MLGISVDSHHSHREYAKMFGIPFPLLSDFNKETAEKYGVLTNSGTSRGVAGRSVFVVSQDGVVTYVWKPEKKGELPDPERVLEAVRKIGQ